MFLIPTLFVVFGNMLIITDLGEALALALKPAPRSYSGWACSVRSGHKCEFKCKCKFKGLPKSVIIRKYDTGSGDETDIPLRHHVSGLSSDIGKRTVMLVPPASEVDMAISPFWVSAMSFAE